MKIKEMINYEWNKKSEDKSQERIIKILVYFIIFMIVCTIISRFADSLTVPIVETEKVTSASINHDITASGVISANNQEGIFSTEGITITSINVQRGKYVKNGDVLFTLNKEEIEEKISSLESELSNKEKTLSRAIEDYNIALSKEDKNIQKALETMENSKKELDEFNENSLLSKEELNNAYEENKNAYEEAINNKDSNLISYKRAVEDANYDKEKEKLIKNINELKELLNNDGKVIANNEGTVTNILLTEGQQTTNEPVLLLADKKSGYKVVAQISTDYEKDISLDQKITLNILDNNEQIEEAVINAISRNEENEHMLDITVILPEGVGEIGKSATLEISNNTERYSSCVPLSALHSDGDKYYVLMFEEKETVLGTENVAKRADITIKDKDGMYAALDENIILTSDEVITSSNKNINDGDRVRKEEE
ncbi:MAG: efflux RND transporter periplasmic adaptor subunit [Clostridium sp.]|jgi:multidrug resistance efflux pump|nr:biotin/lipoyl-binding protein [Clostridium sp.]